MRILVEIGHPAHVHFFRRTLSHLERAGHKLFIITRNKDITNELLERYGFPYRCLSSPKKGMPALVLELLWRWISTIYLLVTCRIDRAVSIAGISTSVPAKLLGIPNVVFTDTEDAHISNWIALPFADVVLTPDFFLGDLGAKQRRYAGLHELAYLQQFDFELAEKRRVELALPSKYFVIRIIKNDALHDRDIKGLSLSQVHHYIEILRPHGNVFITCEGSISPCLEPYRLTTPLTDIHAVLAGASLFIGESPTMAVESSLLGTPAYLMSERAVRLGNMVGLEERFQLLRNFRDGLSLEAALKQITDFNALKENWKVRAKEYRATSRDMDELVRGALLGEAGVTGESELCAA